MQATDLGRAVKDIDRGTEAETLLLRNAQAGDSASVEDLLSGHQRFLYTICYQILGHADDAEDAVQETFLRALRALPRFRGDSSVGTWLVRIAMRVCMDRKSSTRPTQPMNTLPESEIQSNSHSPEAEVLQRMRIAEVLQRLPIRQRAILLLREWHGWSIPEIAESLDWKHRKVNTELYNIRKTLAGWMRQEDGEGAWP
jgi:RNA polymerase sigma-70 factor (ECF subfamily)